MLLYKLSSYGIPKSFINYQVLNGQPAKAQVIINRYPLRLTSHSNSFYFRLMSCVSLYLSFKNFYADDTMVYRFTSQILGDQSLAADLSSDLALKAHCGERTGWSLNEWVLSQGGSVP